MKKRTKYFKAVEIINSNLACGNYIKDLTKIVERQLGLKNEKFVTRKDDLFKIDPEQKIISDFDIIYL